MLVGWDPLAQQTHSQCTLVGTTTYSLKHSKSPTEIELIQDLGKRKDKLSFQAKHKEGKIANLQ